MSQLKTATNILLQLNEVIVQVEAKDYARPLPVLSGNTIGKHVRHILEFFQCLINGYETGVVDYDLRKRNPDIESRKEFALSEANNFIEKIQYLNDKRLVLITHDEEGNDEENATSFNRELTYNNEHAIHHMAILRIALLQECIDVTISENFGVANSTLKYREATCAQ
jgi:hypothetical protein